jgi:two-component system response regulator VicR
MGVKAMERKILLIEDSLTQAMTIKFELERLGYTVGVAHDGQKGLDAVIPFHPDVIVLDLNLPKIDGIEVCRRLKQTGQPDWVRAVPVLMFSAQARLSNMSDAYKAGADHYVTKDREGAGFLTKVLDATFRRLERRRTASA